MTEYKGPAVLTLAGEPGCAGQVILHSTKSGDRFEWRGSFVPDDGAPINGGTATIAASGWSGEVLVQDYRFNGSTGTGTAILLGQDMPPF